jgi:D-alanine transaminase
MSRIAYVNGRYVPHRDAVVHVEDRGFQFADGVYEVTAVRDGRLVDEEPHLERLEYSLSELRIPLPMPRPALKFIQREMIRRNHVRNGIVYMQVTRGVARRDHPFPAGVTPSLVMTARNTKANTAQADAGIAVITTPDIRWGRCDIKSVGLLPNVLAKQKARESGAWETWFVDGTGCVTEGSSTNAWIVTPAGELITRQADHGILNGITRQALKRMCADLQLRLVERPIRVSEIGQASEAFITSATSFVMPVIKVDGATVGAGSPGPVARRLRSEYLRHADSTAAPA